LSKITEEVYSNRREDFNSLKARVFQAIRMEINSEISELKKSVEAAIHCLKSGGRLCVITYHSKETSALREMIHKFEKDCVCDSKLPVCVCGGNHKKITRVNKKAIMPSKEEAMANSRSRSAMLRVYERV
jgi:16S rRNA (cytosine1402-N4)-methyltransferase